MASCCAVRTSGEHADRWPRPRPDDDDCGVEGESRTFDDAIDNTPSRYQSNTAAGTGRGCLSTFGRSESRAVDEEGWTVVAMAMAMAPKLCLYEGSIWMMPLGTALLLLLLLPRRWRTLLVERWGSMSSPSSSALRPRDDEMGSGIGAGVGIIVHIVISIWRRRCGNNSRLIPRGIYVERRSTRNTICPSPAIIVVINFRRSPGADTSWLTNFNHDFSRRSRRMKLTAEQTEDLPFPIGCE